MSLRPSSRLDAVGITLIRRVLAEAPPGALPLGLGQVDADVPEALSTALRAAPSVERAGYELNAGLIELREKVAERYDVDASQVIITTGVQEALALSLFGLVEAGDEVVVPDPGFPVYASLTRMAGGVPVAYRPSLAHRLRPRWDDIEPTLTPQTRLVVLASPGNPTGAVAEPAEWARIGAELAARDIPWLSDEIYLPFQPDGGHGTLWGAGPGLVTAGLSKSHAIAGWRLGWLVAPPELAPALVGLHQHLVTSVATPIQQAALAAFTDAGDAFVAELRHALRRRKTLVESGLTAAGFDVVAGDGAFYLFVRHPAYDDDLTLCRALMREVGVVTIPGRAFGAGGEGFVRVSYAARDEVLEQAMERLVGFG